MKITRAVAQPNKWTYQIPPVKELVERVIGDGKRWADPFCGESKLCEYRNDFNPKVEGATHMLAEEFCAQLPYGLNGGSLDPPFSYRQVVEAYKGVGRKATSEDTTSNFYTRVRVQLAPRIKIGGRAISCGWNTNGFGQYQGFELEEVLVVAHGQHHNDTLVTVERKVTEGPPAPAIDKRGRLD